MGPFNHVLHACTYPHLNEWLLGDMPRFNELSILNERLWIEKKPEFAIDDAGEKALVAIFG